MCGDDRLKGGEKKKEDEQTYRGDKIGHDLQTQHDMTRN